MTSLPIVVANWKMNGSKALIDSLPSFAAVAADQVEVVICPPYTLIAAAKATQSGIKIGGQDCHTERSGAYTGAVSATLLAEAGAGLVILGHSERRALGETNAEIARKAAAAAEAGLRPLICVGEMDDTANAAKLVSDQLRASLPDATHAAQLIVAYEPVWAIGTGRVPPTSHVAQVHATLRGVLKQAYGIAAGSGVPILYGGSVTPANVGELVAMPEIDGVLVGGASLKPDLFSILVKNVRQVSRPSKIRESQSVRQ